MLTKYSERLSSLCDVFFYSFAADLVIIDVIKDRFKSKPMFIQIHIQYIPMCSIIFSLPKVWRKVISFLVPVEGSFLFLVYLFGQFLDRNFSLRVFHWKRQSFAPSILILSFRPQKQQRDPHRCVLQPRLEALFLGEHRCPRTFILYQFKSTDFQKWKYGIVNVRIKPTSVLFYFLRVPIFLK